MEQKRLFLAFILSAVVLFGWTYFFAPKGPQQKNANDAQISSNQREASTEVTPQPTAPESPATSPLVAADNVAQRGITVASPLYEVKIDNRGAVATSWIIKQNKETGRALYSVASDGTNQKNLELIPPASILKNVPDAPRPLALSTSDSNLNNFLSSSNYSISGIDDQSDDVRLELQPSETRRLDFILRDESTGIEVVKTLRFNPESYTVDVGVKLLKGGQPVPKVNLTVGPSIGDQGVPQYSFYSVAPEVVLGTREGSTIYVGQSIHDDKDLQSIAGPVDWVAVGDTYFAMAAVPPAPVQGTELRSVKYNSEINGAKEDRYLVSTYLPIPADGSLTRVFVGPKDHDLLTRVSGEISASVNRSVNLDGLINYGWLGFIARPLTAPIFWSLKHLHTLTGSYGSAIIIFTIIIYSLFFPLKWRSSKAMKKAQRHAPRMKEVQEKMKGLKQTDPRLKELQTEQLRLMKEANPLGGCLPLLIQMPFLIALYTAITISIDFRQSSFLWMPDLSAADPYRLLPILMAGSMVVLQFITPAPSADPLQRKMMAVVLPAVMLYMLWTAPAGLLVYWFVGNIVGFIQQFVINRLVKSEDDEQQQPPQEKTANKPKKLSPARMSQA